VAARFLRGRMDCRAASADRLRARIDGSGGGGQAKNAMSPEGRGLRGRAGGRIQAIPPQSGVTACRNKWRSAEGTAVCSETS